MQPQETENTRSWTGLLSVLIIAGIPFLYCYFMFFAFHDSILNFHRPSDQMISLVLDPHNIFGGNDQHDGIEPYVLFLMVLLTGPLGYLLYRSNFPKNILTVIGGILWAVFFFELHLFQNFFTQPGGNIMSWIKVVVVFGGFTFLLKWVYEKSSLLGQFLVAQLLLIICFIPYCDISYFDYSFLLAPALRWIQTGRISDTFFQYDILPSIPALYILKNHLSVYAYRYAAEGSMFVLMAGLFITARKFFMNKNLAFALLVLAVMIRFFMGLSDVTFCAQSTAIRLDWWLLLFAAAYFFGLADIRTGIVMFLLLIFINQWGVIYLACYLAVVGCLFLLDAYNSFQHKESFSFQSFTTGYVKKFGANLALCLAGMIVFRILTGSFIDESVKFFGGFQIGMLPIEQTSLFWYFAATYVFAATLLLVYRKLFAEHYFVSAVFLLALSAGNCMYFFGRSHENNVIHVSTSLVFVTVLCCDLLWTLSKNEVESFKGMNKFISASPLVLVLLVLMTNNSEAFVNNTGGFVHTLKNGPWTYEEEMPVPGALETIKALTNGSPKVYFMTLGDDFYLYYRGGYSMPAKINPIQSWCIYQEQIDFANQKLAEGYYIIAPGNDVCFRKDFLPKMKYNHLTGQGGYIALSN